MPYRVASFFESQVINLTNTIRSRPESPNRTRTRTRSAEPASRSAGRGASPHASSVDEDRSHSPSNSRGHSFSHSHGHRAPTSQSNSQPARQSSPPSLDPVHPHINAVRPPFPDDKKDRDHHHHRHPRLSFPGLPIYLGRSHHKEQHTNPHAQLSWKIESPPIIFHGDAENSTGALVSGQLFLDIKDESYNIESFQATLTIHVTQKKPFTVHCPDCTHQYTQLKEWQFLPVGTRALQRGVHPFPFSVLLDGHLPATLDSPLVNVTYEFKAEAIPAATGAPAIKLEKLFNVKRSQVLSELPHHSVRVFPPTNVKASVHYQQVVYPIGTNTLSMRLDGIARACSASPPETATVEYWKLKKLTWRLEETLKTVAPACDKHKAVSSDSVQQQQHSNGTAHTETHVIGEKTLLGGWKSSYGDVTDSLVELELEYALSMHARYSCDLRARDGTEVSHHLMLEMVVSQECAPLGKPGLVRQTGVGRILRMHFGIVLTEPGGIGISWDNEAPPIYQDVPPSPPAYFEDDTGAWDGMPELMEDSLYATSPGARGSNSALASGRSSRRTSVDGYR